MPPSKFTYDLPPDAQRSVLREVDIETGFIDNLQGLNYEYRRDMTDRAKMLLSQKFLEYSFRNSERGKIPKFNRNVLLTFEALIPATAEQQRFATCLSSLDAMFTAET